MQEETNFTPLMPKEHGMWTWIIVPLLGGGIYALGDAERFWFFFLSVLFFFLCFTPARILYKFSRKKIPAPRRAVVWCLVYGVAGFACSLFTLISLPVSGGWYVLYGLLFYLGVRASHAGFQRGLWFEFGGITALSTLSLASAMIASGSIRQEDVAVWFLILIFLFDRSFQTRHAVRNADWYPGPPDPASLKIVFKANLFTALMSIIAVSGALQLFELHRIVVAAFLPGFLATSIYNFFPPRKLRTLGWAEMLVAFLFTITLLGVA